MSLCDTILEDKVSWNENFADIKCYRDTIKNLQVIKKLMYSNGHEEIQTLHNQVMATIC